MKLSMNPFETTIINIFDVETKKIIFTGSIADGAKYLNIGSNTLCSALRAKRKFKKKKYTARHASIKNERV